MLLKKISLRNIRSYGNQEIDFPKGSTLLSGDIGSGKTSILLAIEFALFGLQPGQRGNALLKNGTDEGGVVLNFEVNGKEIEVERHLKKNKTISQSFCSISVDGDKKETSVTELKSDILNLLNYPSEFSKKQNILYKFTVYTPQEEMKQIILHDPETRINTLRHVFGIDKYKKILENISIIASKLREEKRLKQGQVMSLEEDNYSLVQKEQELEIKQQSLVSLEKELLLKIEERKDKQKEKEEVSRKISERDNLKKEIEKSKLMLSNKSEHINDNKKKINLLQEQIQEIRKSGFNELKIINIQKEMQNIEVKKQELDKRKIEVYSLISSLESKNEENNKIKEKLSYIEVCPTCLQNVNTEYKENVIKKLNTKVFSNKNELDKLNKEKEKILKEVFDLENISSLKQKELSDLNILKIKFQTIEEKEKQIIDIEKNNYSLQGDVDLLSQQISSLYNTIFELNKFEKTFETKTKEFDELVKQERNLDIKVAELKKEIDLFSKQIQDLKDKIKRTKEIKKSLDRISELEFWLTSNFASLISLIEKNVMIKLKHDFSELFSKWFSMLVSDSFNIKLDENFTPIVEQKDYEINYNYLSGGERTAIALAYRLALNQVINSLISKIRTKDLVILDEPTDGFSDNQLDKMRDVLQELNIGQLIIVSHESKIESFVENVIKFEKDKGISRKI